RHVKNHRPPLDISPVWPRCHSQALPYMIASLAAIYRGGDLSGFSGGIMKKLMLTVASFAMLVAAPAIAADMARPVLKAPPPAPVWNWTGFYIGGNVGYLVEHDQGTSTFTQPGADPFTPEPNSVAQTSWVGGGQIGYNWQVAPWWVIGVEADWDWT